MSSCEFEVKRGAPSRATFTARGGAAAHEPSLPKLETPAKLQCCGFTVWWKELWLACSAPHGTMSGHLQPTDFSLPTELSPSPEPASPAAADNAEAPSTNGEAPPTRRAQLVMGPPLGGEPDDGGSGLNEEVTPHQEMQNNAQLLAGLEDDAMDLELTHARIRTLRGVGIERFRNVEVHAGA